ncbi:MAG: Calx-beta domain-containing protein, partial [Pyrinomonadaceae bacterium]
IYVMNADGSGQTRLTNNAGVNVYPAFSPDGSKIAFASARDGNAEIYVMNADGSGQTRLTNNAAGDYHPAWQPIGKSASPSAFQFGNMTYSASENGAFATITVMRTNGISVPASISYATSNGTATAGSDYTAVSGTFDFAADDRSKTFSIPILEDNVYEGNETVTLTLSNPTNGATLGTPSTATLTILDNEAKPEITIDNQTVAEFTGGTGTAKFNVTLSHSSPETITLNIATANNTAISPGDYTAIPTTTITFAPGQTTKQVQVTTSAYSPTQASKTFFVNLSNAINATILDNQGVGTICPQCVNNGKIVFSSDREDGLDYNIYTMHSDGSGAVKLTSFDNYHMNSHASFSPDGRRIVFVNGVSISTINSDGSGLTELARISGAFVRNPSFSPDGSKIVFTTSPTRENTRIYLMNSDGSAMDSYGRTQIQLTNGVSSDYEPSFSPDGSKIVFTSKRIATDNPEIYTMNSDGSAPTRLTNSAGIDQSPSFSPDGSKIVFSTNRGGGNYEIYSMNSNGSGVTGLTNLPSNELDPSFSPDGSKIVFTSDRIATTRKIYTMNSDGSALTRLTNNYDKEFYPKWQPVSLYTTFSSPTQTGQNVAVAPTNNLNMTFSNVTTAGTTTATALSQDQLQPLPSNFSLTSNPIMYDITTSAVYSGNITVTFNVPNIASATACSQLRILHYINNAWDMSGNFAPSYNSATGVCTVSQSVSSLSPFVVVQINAAPSYEGDVSPRPNGDGVVQSSDVVQVRRFQNGTDTPSTN